MNYNYITIKNWSVEDRPREKLLKNGYGFLTDAELLAILIGSGTKSVSALDLAKTLLNQVDNNLGNLRKTSLKNLMSIKGIGYAKAINIISALELGYRSTQDEPAEKIRINGSTDAFKIFEPILGELPHEEFWILLLNRGNKVIDKHRMSQGGVSGTVIDTRMILRKAIEHLATGMIICHNHPSGNRRPSKQDVAITHKIFDSADMLDIKLLDHIIVAGKRYFSFADNKIMPVKETDNE